MSKSPAARRISMAVADILLIGICLIIFALFHHVIPRDETPEVLPTANRPTLTPIVTATPGQSAITPSDTPASATPIQDGWYYEKFTGGEVVQTATTYASKDIYIDITTAESNGSTCYIVDIHIRSIDNLKTAFAGNKFGIGHVDRTENIAADNNAIIAINGDYCCGRNEGTVIRNGAMYRDSVLRDVCVLYYDGTMKTFSKADFNAKTELNNGAYQAWSFGPMLVDANGNSMVKAQFDTDVNRANPRTAIGYYAPGHYCFVAVDGRPPSGDNGMTLEQLSAYMVSLGCKVAYNLDGGQSSVMVFNNEIVNVPANGGRKMSDIIYIGEVEE